MEKCNNCGAAGQDGKFCGECGKPLTTGAAPAYARYAVLATVAVVAVAVFLLVGLGGAPVNAEDVSGAVVSAGVQDSGEPAAQTEVENLGTRTLVTSIQGMSCGGCVSLIEGTVSKMSGVQSVDVSLGQRQGVIVYDPNAVDKQEIINTISNLGYPCSEISDTDGSQSPVSGSQTSVQTTSGAASGYGGCGCGG